MESRADGDWTFADDERARFFSALRDIQADLGARAVRAAVAAATADATAERERRVAKATRDAQRDAVAAVTARAAAELEAQRKAWAARAAAAERAARGEERARAAEATAAAEARTARAAAEAARAVREATARGETWRADATRLREELRAAQAARLSGRQPRGEATHGEAKNDDDSDDNDGQTAVADVDHRSRLVRNREQLASRRPVNDESTRARASSQPAPSAQRAPANASRFHPRFANAAFAAASPAQDDANPLQATPFDTSHPASQPRQAAELRAHAVRSMVEQLLRLLPHQAASTT